MYITAPLPAPKGGRLTGGALSEESLDSSASVLRLHRGRPGATVGLQQFFSPPEAAALCAGVMGASGSVLDPTAGRGDLMAAWPRVRRFGVEIDPDHVGADAYTALRGDLQQLYPLMRAARLRFEVVLLNPPFGMD